MCAKKQVACLRKAGRRLKAGEPKLFANGIIRLMGQAVGYKRGGPEGASRGIWLQHQVPSSLKRKPLPSGRFVQNSIGSLLFKKPCRSFAIKKITTIIV